MATFRALFGALGAVLRGTLPGVRAVFMATLLLQVTFQGFASWYVLHGTERFGGRPEDLSVGFIAWAMGGVVGSLPAGFIGVRVGRRNAMLGGFALMAASFLALDRVTSLGSATALLALASAAWTLPAVSYRSLFLVLAGYTAAAFAAVLVPRGAGEAETGEAIAPSPA